MQLILRMFENGTSFPIGLNLCLTYKDWCGPAGQGLSPLSHLWPFTQHCWWRARFCVPGGASLTIVALCVCVCVGIYCDSYIKVQYSTPFCRETSEAFSLLFFKKKKKRKAPYFSPRPPLKMHLVPIPSHSDLSEYRKLCRTLTLWADVFRFQFPSPYSGVSTRHSAGILG